MTEKMFQEREVPWHMNTKQDAELIEDPEAYEEYLREQEKEDTKYFDGQGFADGDN